MIFKIPISDSKSDIIISFPSYPLCTDETILFGEAIILPRLKGKNQRSDKVSYLKQSFNQAA
jgi:hypothetical protein